MNRALAALMFTALSACEAVGYATREPLTGRDVEVVGRCGEEFVRVDGVEGPSFSVVARSTLTLANGHVAYAASDDAGAHFVVDGHALAGPFEEIVSVRPLGPAAWLVLESKEGRVRFHEVGPASETRAHPWADGVLEGSVALGPRGRVAYVAERGKERCVVATGARERCFDGVASLVWGGPSGDVLAYGARRGDAAFVVRGAEVFGPFEDFAGLESGGRGQWALVREEDAWFVTDGARRLGPYVRVGELSFAEDRPVFWATRESARCDDVESASCDEEKVVVDDGVEHGPFGSVEDLEIGADGATVSYIDRGAQRDTLYVNHAASASAAPFPRITEVAIGADGRVGFVARDGESRVVVVEDEVLGAWVAAQELTLVAPGRDLVLARSHGVDVVVEGKTEHPIGHALSGSLVVDASGRGWAIASVGEDGVMWHRSGSDEARAVDVEAIVGEVLRARGDEGEAALRAWLEGALALERSKDAPRDRAAGGAEPR